MSIDYKDFYSDLSERHGGSKKERSIWYHGTSMKKLPGIISNGLIPNVPQKGKSWGSDPYVDILNLDKTSYGGVYVSQHLMSALSSAGRTSRADKTNSAIVIMELQPRSLIGDEDDFASRLKDLSNNLAGSSYHNIYPYMWEVYGAPDYHKEYADNSKRDWCKKSFDSLFYDFKFQNTNLKQAVYKILYDYGYIAMLTRNVSYIKRDDYSTYWQWRKVYAEVKGMKDYGMEENIPDPPSPGEAEKLFRTFIDKLTRTMKSKARHSFTGSYSKTGRSMEPIKFKGSNRITAIVELVKSSESLYREDVKVLYGTLPEDFKKQWQENVGELRIVT